MRGKNCNVSPLCRPMTKLLLRNLSGRVIHLYREEAARETRLLMIKPLPVALAEPSLDPRHKLSRPSIIQIVWTAASLDRGLMQRTNESCVTYRDRIWPWDRSGLISRILIWRYCDRHGWNWSLLRDAPDLGPIERATESFFQSIIFHLCLVIISLYKICYSAAQSNPRRPN